MAYLKRRPVSLLLDAVETALRYTRGAIGESFYPWKGPLTRRWEHSVSYFWFRARADEFVLLFGASSD